MSLLTNTGIIGVEPESGVALTAVGSGDGDTAPVAAQVRVAAAHVRHRPARHLFLLAQLAERIWSEKSASG